MAITVYPYAAAVGYGVSIHLDAVQVLDLVEYNRRSASSYGFEVDQNGYSVTETTNDNNQEETYTAVIDDSDTDTDGDF